PAPDWKDPLSLSVTLLIVGAAVWVAHWRHSPWAADRQSLSRKLYVWAALLGSVLAVLAGGVGIVNAVLQQTFSAHPRLDDPANLDFAQYLALIVVAVGVGVYHWIVLRGDAAARPPKPATAPAIAKVAVIAAPAATEPAQATEALEPHGLRYFGTDPACCVTAHVEPGDDTELGIDTGGEDGAVRYRRVGRLVFTLAGQECRLTVLSLVQYAGGLFVPFRDRTSGRETYGGG